LRINFINIIILWTTSTKPRASDTEDKKLYTAATARYSVSKVFRKETTFPLLKSHGQALLELICWLPSVFCDRPWWCLFPYVIIQSND